MDPMASQNMALVACVRYMHTPATVTPTTEAESSTSTAVVVGSLPLWMYSTARNGEVHEWRPWPESSSQTLLPPPCCTAWLPIWRCAHTLTEGHACLLGGDADGIEGDLQGVPLDQNGEEDDCEADAHVLELSRDQQGIDAMHCTQRGLAMLHRGRDARDTATNQSHIEHFLPPSLISHLSPPPSLFSPSAPHHLPAHACRSPTEIPPPKQKMPTPAMRLHTNRSLVYP